MHKEWLKKFNKIDHRIELTIAKIVSREISINDF